MKPGKEKELGKENGNQGPGKRKSLSSVKGYGCNFHQGADTGSG
jgi:hypothetical protein